jgi:outer membrane protein assembly factor BamB
MGSFPVDSSGESMKIDRTPRGEFLQENLMFAEDEPVQEPWEALDALQRDREPVAGSEWILDDLVFVGFNSRIAALDRATGELIWDWKAPHGSGFVAILLDIDQLIVSVSGYTYALDPATGDTLWTNLLKGFGYGIPCLVSKTGSTLGHSAAAAETEAQQSRQNSSHNTGGTAGPSFTG